jgi:hypothetical protein
LNQARVFTPYAAWVKDKEAFRKNLLHLVRAAHQRGIGLMPVMQYAPGVSANKERWPESREFVADLVKTIGKEPGLAFWDVYNEPECCALPPSPANRTRMEHAAYMAKMFHELDPVTPVTIGFTFSANMIEMGDAVDVLSFHNYLTTRAAIRADIAKAKAYAAKTGKPLIYTEIGCIARANPYDVALEEHMKAGVGWYIWELMIVRSGWGNVHGVFYEDGSVRDPSIPAAIMGFFRKRSPDMLPSTADHEGWVTKIIDQSNEWLTSGDKDREKGLDIAETAAHLLEAGELTAMRIPPTAEVEMLRQKETDIKALELLITKFRDQLEPYKKVTVAEK